MKKALALILAMVMVLSLICTAGAVEFNDADKIDIMNSEAVTVLSELGVIAGMEDGNFAPEATLTRAQAAKILCCLKLGAESANALTSSKATFTDVPAAHWSNKFVEYCAANGIVSGTGANKFNPNGKLTGFAFGKMLLTAIGFDAAKEGLTGNGWDKNVSKLLKNNKLNLGVTVSSKEISREDACRLALNCMFYGESENPDDTLAYKTFGVTRLMGHVVKGNPDWGRPYMTYSSFEDGKYWDGTELNVLASPVILDTKPITGDSVCKTMGVQEITSEQIDSVIRDTVFWNVKSYGNNFQSGNTKAIDCSGNGIETQIYYDAVLNNYRVVQIALHAAKVSSVVPPVLFADGTVDQPGTVTFENGFTASSTTATEADVGNYMLYKGFGTESWNKVAGATKTVEGQVITGIFEGYEKKTVKIGGKNYTNAYRVEVTGEAFVAEGGAIGDEVKALLDSDGFIYAIWP